MNDDVPYHLLVVILVVLIFLLMAVQDTFFPLGKTNMKDSSSVALMHNKIQYLSTHPNTI